VLKNNDVTIIGNFFKVTSPPPNDTTKKRIMLLIYNYIKFTQTFHKNTTMTVVYFIFLLRPIVLLLFIDLTKSNFSNIFGNNQTITVSKYNINLGVLRCEQVVNNFFVMSIFFTLYRIILSNNKQELNAVNYKVINC